MKLRKFSLVVFIALLGVPAMGSVASQNVLFESGFETGDLTGWDMTPNPNRGGNLSVMSESPYQGSYCLKAEAAATRAYLVAQKFLDPPLTLVYVRTYVRFTKIDVVKTSIKFIRIFNRDFKATRRGELFQFRPYLDVDGMKWMVSYWDDFANKTVGTPAFGTGPEIGMWYCVEAMVKLGAGDGEVRVWVDDVEIWNKTGLHNVDAGKIDTVHIGLTENSPGLENTVVYIDRVVISTTKIGPELGVQPNITRVFNAGIWNGTTYYVTLTSNSTVRGFNFNQSMMRINFNVIGLSGSTGYCKVTVLNDLLGGPYTVLMDNSPITLVETLNSTHASLYFKYPHTSTTHKVTIIGTTVVLGDINRPRANAGSDLTVNEDASVTFDGSASWDNIGIVSYTWTFMDATPQTLTGINPNYVFVTPGIYNVTLNVTDAAGNWATDTIVIRVLDITNPIADAGSDQTAKAGRAVIFDAGKSTDNVGIVTYEWDFGDGTRVAGPWWVKAMRAYAKPGTYTVKLTVKDAAGNNGTDSITIIVEEVPVEEAPIKFPWWILVNYWWVIVASILIAAELIVHRRKHLSV